jgi:hypothetical protein
MVLFACWITSLLCTLSRIRKWGDGRKEVAHQVCTHAVSVPLRYFAVTEAMYFG